MTSITTFSNITRTALVSACVAASSAAASLAHAESISYFIDQSNTLADGVNYAEVTVSDSPDAIGDIDFTVEILWDAFTVSGDNFGMQTFLFNYDDALSLDTSNITGLSEPWKTSFEVNAGGGFGKYDIGLLGTGSSRTDMLTFSISDVAGDSIYSYIIGSSLNPEAEEFFSTHIAGFDSVEGETSAKFAGSTQNPVPVPAAVWLFGTGLIGLVAVARGKA